MHLLTANGTSLLTAFQMEKGLTAFVGGGGKTTAILYLADALKMHGSVVITTSTHIFPPVGMLTLPNPSAADIQNALRKDNPICIGAPEESGKLAAPSISMEELSQLADYVLVEADGAKGMPLKAPAAHEPVIPENATMVIAVAGLDGIGHAVTEAAFRPELYADVLGCALTHSITPEDVARVLLSERGQYKQVRAQMRFAVLLNKADDDVRMRLARQVAEYLDTARVERVVIANCKEMPKCLS